MRVGQRHLLVGSREELPHPPQASTPPVPGGSGHPVAGHSCPISGPDSIPQRRVQGDTSVWQRRCWVVECFPSVQKTQHSVLFPNNGPVSSLEVKPVCLANTGSPGFTCKGTGGSTQKTLRELPALAKSAVSILKEI